jgi:molecular chaperone GrpE
MDDHPEPDDPISLSSEALLPPIDEDVSFPVVQFVVPALVYDSVDTDDELAREESAPSPTLPGLDRLSVAIREMSDTIGKRLDGLQTVFEREIRAESTREKVVDRLHAELQDYKQDLLLNTLRPMFIDLIQLHDDLGKMSPGPDGADEAGRVLRLIENVQQGIEDILYRQGVEPFTNSDTIFDPRRQRAIATVTTDNAELAKRVAARHRKGFQMGERVIRPEIVSVYSVKRE